jgi:hypothetical protein
MDTLEQAKPRSEYSEKWQQRFAFFDLYGAPNSPAHKPALVQLPFGQKIKINMNIIAFFFGPIYLFVLGLWKKNLTLIALLLVVSTVVDIIVEMTGFPYGKQIDFGLGFGFNVLYGVATNYAYYLKEVKGEQGWNPFRGMRW